jgi:DNA-binding beta-propeller fold protein YncE
LLADPPRSSRRLETFPAGGSKLRSRDATCNRSRPRRTESRHTSAPRGNPLDPASENGLSRNGLRPRQTEAPWTRSPATTFAGPTSSQPLALDTAGSVLAVVNPDDVTVSFFDLTRERKKPSKIFAVQKEPWGVAILPDGSKAYVANTVSGTVSVVLRNSKGKFQKPELSAS